MSNKKSKSIIMVVAAAMLWGTYGSFVTEISALGMSTNAIIILRFIATTIPVFLYLFFTDREQLRIKKEDIPLFLANGLASIFFFVYCYTAAIKETKIATAAALLYTAPAMVMLMSALLFKEKLTKRKVLCVLLAVLGCAFVSGIGFGDAGLTPRGILLGLGAAFGYSLYSIFSRFIQQRGYSTFTNLFYTFGTATIAYLIVGAATKTLPKIWPPSPGLELGLICGLVTGLGAYALYTTGLEGMEPSRAAQLATIEPVFAAFLGVILFRQTLSITEIAGIMMVVTAVILMNK
jgi:drug/metabolite transporter (DMT)-like permease